MQINGYKVDKCGIIEEPVETRGKFKIDDAERSIRYIPMEWFITSVACLSE